MDEYEDRHLSGYLIRIDRTICVGTQNCVHVAPEVFVLAEDQIVTFLPDAPDIEPDRLIEACAVCPVGALLVFDAEGKRLVP